MKRLYSVICLWLAVSAPALASMAPDELVRETTDEVLAKLEANRAEYEADREKLFQMVEKIVVPHFDMERMSRFVLGKHWGDASPEQQAQFIEQFKTQLVRTYATALFEYTSGQEIIYKPFRHEEGERKAIVKTEIPREDGPSLPVQYNFIDNDGEWKVYDVVIENLSTVQNYRAQYGRVVQTRGVEELIAALSEKNKKLMGGQ